MGSGPSIPISQCLLSAVGGKKSLVSFPKETTQVPLFNLNLPVIPSAVISPESAEQVAAIVKCAADSGYKVQPKSGGHSYANHGTVYHFRVLPKTDLGSSGFGGSDGAVVVDMRNFQKFSTDSSTYSATIGSGTLLGDVAARLHKEGRAMAHGTCPQVGIGGHATTGGIGPASRLWGLALDHITEVEVVLANSSIVKASQIDYPDVFFALKGAGPSFGIITEFTVRTQPEPRDLVQYQYMFNCSEPTSRAEILKKWQTLVSDPAIPREFHSMLDVFPHKIVVSGTYFGSKRGLDALKLNDLFSESQDSSVTITKDWIGLVDSWSDHVRRNFGGGTPRSFYAKSLDFATEKLIPSHVIDQLFEFLANAYKGPRMVFVSFHLGGGAINDVFANATAYPHRCALFWMQFAAAERGPVSAATKNVVDGINSIVTHGMAGVRFGAYSGHIDPELPNALEAYWGVNLPRLRHIKRSIDPRDLFHNPQSISATPGASWDLLSTIFGKDLSTDSKQEL
ncbi:putative glucooligosaccharide oxidase [Phaeomoniella chlamydospora]|uniref:Putative glucooligosaccharide oxidase n=1 Tax=Phaeomoniella chlamydospora TaxID=158046 RepID=A0A0G2EQC8_PHACM|nr:putative glucooligosaccharide oxidase [Phaeomoniella chlamydospora]